MKTPEKLVPELRFSEFEGTFWEYRKVSSLLKKVSDPVLVDTETVYREIGIRSHGKGVFHKEPIIGKALGEKRVFWVSTKAFVINIVFAWEQSVALTSEAERGFIASHRFLMFLPENRQASLEFVLYFFKRKRGKYLLGLASPGGAGRNKTLGQNEFLNLNVLFPSVEEQQKIAFFLTSIDDKLTKLRRKRELLNDFKRSLMQQLFSQTIRFKQDDGSEFPEWEDTVLEKVANVVGGGTPDTFLDDYWGGDIQWFTPSEIKSKYLLSSKRTISDKGLKASSAKLLPKGSLLLSTRATVGDVGIALRESTTNQGFQSLIIKPDNSNEFWYYWLKSNKKTLLRKSSGSTFLEIGKREVVKLAVKKPIFSEQQKIADCLSSFDAKIDAVAQQIQQLDTFKKGLLQKMFV